MASLYSANTSTSRSKDDKRKYFAAMRSDDLAAAVWERFRDGQRLIRSSGKHTRFQRSLRLYYAVTRNGRDATDIHQGGRSGELTVFQPNHYRNLTQHVLAMVTGAPAYRKCQASNTDSESMQQVMLGDGIVEYYTAERKLDERMVEALERSLVLCESWIGAPWDPNIGEEVGVAEYLDTDTGEMHERVRYGGDFAFPVLTPYEAVIEPHAEDPDEPSWGIFRRRISKHRLAALYPQYADEIMECEPATELVRELGYDTSPSQYDDKIAVLELYARRGPELLTGRQAFVISPHCAIFDDALEYKTIPYFRLAPSDVILGDGGYSSNMDLLPVCQAINAQATTLLSNNTAFGAQMLSMTRGSGLKKEDLGALKVLMINPGHEIKPVQLTASAPESYTFLDVLTRMAETFQGVGAAQRGNVDAMKGDSGAKQALIASMAQQFQGPVQKAKSRAEEALLTHLIDTVKLKVSEPRIATLSGKFNANASKSYTGKDVERIVKVRVKTGDPMMASPEGREMRLDKLLALPGAPTFVNPEQVIAFLETGRIEHVTEAPMSQLMLIRKENELLSDPAGLGEVGGPPIVAPVDNHIAHIHEHMVVLNDPSVRNDPMRVRLVSEHVLWHIECLTPGAPRFAGFHVLAATGQQPLPLSPMGMASGGPGAPVGPQQPGGKPPKDGGGAESPKPKLPSGPVNPATGKPVHVDLPAPGNQAAPG